MRLLLPLALLLLTGCPLRPPVPDGGTHDAGAYVDDGGFPHFALGLEYTELGLADALKPSGLRWAKTRLEAFTWGQVEPAAPVSGVHSYNFSCTDALVKEYQAAGFTQLLSYLSSKSSWGDVSATDVMPKPAAMADYRAFVRALFERYDGDGIDDMPGLLAPIRFWVVGGEWTGFWGSGNADDYLALLTATRAEATAASGSLALGTIPFMMFDVFQGDVPTQAEIDARLTDPPPAWRDSAAGMKKILDHPELFDFVDVHSLGDYTELPPTLSWLRAQMASRSYTRPIWIDDAFSCSFLANYHPTPNVGWPATFPVTEPTYQSYYQQLQAIADPTKLGHAAAQDWLRTETGTGLIKKAVTALGEGAVGIALGNTEDWMHDSLTVFRTTQMNLLGASAAMGLLDVTHTDYAECKPRVPGPPRAGLANLGLLSDKLGTDVEGVATRLTLAGTARGYQIDRAGQRLFVIWNEDRVLQLPGQAEAPQSVTLPMGTATSATVTRAATATQPVSASSQPVVGGSLTLNVDAVPLFIEPK